MKHVVCYSGGEASAKVAFEVARRFGVGDMTLINHDMAEWVEHEDIKRFKRECAQRLQLPITFVNYMDATQDQFDVCVKSKAFKVGGGSELCTSRLKTEPFMKWLAANCDPADTTIYYGFDAVERARIQRRSGIMAAQGWKTDFPLALWPLTLWSLESVGIAKPLTYSTFKHGNCVGCLKAGWQHWYVIYCTRPDIWAKGKWAEEEIGYAIHHDGDGPVYLDDMEERFSKMKAAGVPATEHIQHQTFWAMARRVVKIAAVPRDVPCECTEGA